MNKIIKKLLIFPYFLDKIRKRQKLRLLKKSSPEEVFNDYYHTNHWGGKNSISGKGSDEDQTKIISDALPMLFENYHIHSVLDIPCGDFNWMKNVDLSQVNYTGADIVRDLISKNQQDYTRENIHFSHLDLIKDQLPAVDLIFCRDCLVHLSNSDIQSALSNICNSQSKYLLTTTFTERKENKDILTGQWRALNLQLDPFRLPVPVKRIDEGCTQDNGAFKDKALALWLIDDIRKIIT